MAAKKEETTRDSKFLTYRDKPLVRQGNTLYYGNPGDKFLLALEILSTRELDGHEIADKVSVQLINSDPNARKKVVNSVEKRGLYNALDIGSIWLERALAENV